MKELILILNSSKETKLDNQDFITEFNKFIKSNKKKDISVSLYTFNSNVQSVFDHVLIRDITFIKNINSLGECEFYNSLGTILERVSDRVNSLKGKETPEEVIVALISENYFDVSKDYTKEEIHTFITYQKEDYDWKFLFFSIGVKNDLTEIGLSEEDIYHIDCTSDGLNKAFTIIESRV